LDFFNIDKEKFPLLAEIEDYVLEATLKKGDCMFVPSHHWVQYETQEDESTILAFKFGSSSKYVDMLI